MEEKMEEKEKSHCGGGQHIVHKNTISGLER